MLTPTIYFEQVPKTINMNIRSELYYVNNFTFAISVILSAQATDKKVNEVVKELYKIVKTPQDILNLGIDNLREYLKVLSFFNNKTKNIFQLSKILVTNNQELPKTKQELIKLPGIGNKTANVITNVLYDAPNIGVDTHVFRLSHRFNWVEKNDNTPDKVETKLLKVIPKKYHKIVNHVMVLHGRYVCKANKPLCQNCIVLKYCNFFNK